MIELIMVMGILAILATFFMTSFPASQRRARDTQRQNDLNQYRVALETYAGNNNGLFPRRTGTLIHASDQSGSSTSLCGDLGLSNCPEDPKDGQNNCDGKLCRYYYQGGPGCGSGGDACATRYTLRTRLENEAGHFVFCSNGRSGIVTESTTFSTGICPSGL